MEYMAESIDYSFSPKVLSVPQEIKPDFGLTQRILDTRLGKFVLATMCSVALSGIFSSESTAATNIGKARAVSYIEDQDVGLGGARISLIPECANPSISAPLKTQLQAFSCLHEFIQESVSETPPMTLSSSLSASAMQKTEDIVKCGFSHYACDKPFTFFMPKIYRCYGENLARTPPNGPLSEGTAQQRFSALMASPEHRANLENPNWDEYGVALIRVGKINYFTTQFGSFSPCPE